MTQATLYINKLATLINGNSVTNYKLGDVSKAINGYNEVKVIMTSTPEKMEKYKAVIINNGFRLGYTQAVNAGWDGELSDVSMYEMLFINNK